MDVLDADSFETFQEVVEPALAADGIWRGELTFRTRSGALIPVSALFLAHENHLGRLESISAVARDITDLKDAERRLRQLATHDYLTGLPNRVLLYDRLEQALARFHRHGQPVALLYLDLDRFKPVNDELRPPGRRRGAGRDRRAASTPSSATPTPRPASAATSSPCWSRASRTRSCCDWWPIG